MPESKTIIGGMIAFGFDFRLHQWRVGVRSRFHDTLAAETRVNLPIWGYETSNTRNAAHEHIITKPRQPEGQTGLYNRGRCLGDTDVDSQAIYFEKIAARVNRFAWILRRS